MQADNGPAAEANGAAVAAAAAAPVPAAPAAGSPDESEAQGLLEDGGQHGHSQGGEAAGGAVDLASLRWPLPLPEGFMQSHRDTGKRGTQQRILLWAAATLQALQAGPLPLEKLFAKAAPTIGQTAPEMRSYSGSAPHSLARQLLRRLGLVESRQRRNASHLWSLAQGPAVEAAVDRIVTAARAAVDLKPVGAEGADAAAAAADGAAAGLLDDASEDRRGSKRGQGTGAEQPSGRRQRRQRQAESEQQGAGGSGLIGRSLFVWWDDGAAYLGKITAYDSDEELHTVVYEDQDVRQHDLTGERHILLAPGQEAADGTSAHPSSSAAAAAVGAAAAQPVAATLPLGEPAAPPGCAAVPPPLTPSDAPAAPAAPVGAQAVAPPPPPPAPGAPPGGPAAAASGAAAGGSGGGPAPQLPAHNDPQVAALLADEDASISIVEVLLDLASWAGVSAAQSAEFGYEFLHLSPPARMLRYRMLTEAASHQDAQKVRRLLVGDGAPGRGKRLSSAAGA